MNNTKRKFNILSYTILTIITCSIMLFIYEVANLAYAFNNKVYKISDTVTLNLSLNNADSLTTFKLNNIVNGNKEVLSFIPDVITIPVKEGVADNNLVLLQALGIPMFIGVIFILIYYIKFILAVRRGSIFEKKVLKHLQKLGLILLTLGVVECIYSIIEYNNNCKAFNIEGFNVAYDSGWFFMSIILGLTVLLLTEFVKLGIQMKEEQELTI